MSRTSSDLPSPGHLLVRLPNPVGDAVMATPALRALRRALPEARITWAGRRAAHEVLEGLSGERDGVVPIASPMADGTRGPIRVGKMLRKLDCDAAVLLPNSWSSALEAQRARIPVRVGSSINRRGPLLTDVVDLPLCDGGRLTPRSMVDHYLDLVGPFGARGDGAGPKLATTAFDEERAAQRLRGLDPALPILGVNPGAAFGPSKCYPPASIAAAVAKVRGRTACEVLVLCGPGEESQAQEVQEALAAVGIAGHATHADVPDLGELKALLRRCRVLATTDAGPRHVAEAFGVPTVVWIGPTDPLWSAHSGATLVRRADLECLACHEKTCPLEGHPCMRELEPAIVAEAIGQHLP